MNPILIVEQGRLLGQRLGDAFADENLKTRWVPTAEKATRHIGHFTVDCAIISCSSPEGQELDLIHALLQTNEHVVVVGLAPRNVDPSLDRSIIDRGAVAVLHKPIDLELLTAVVRNHLRNQRVIRAWGHSRRLSIQRYGLHQIIGSCPAMDKARSLVRSLHTLGPTGRDRMPPVLIAGEFGTGKRLFARAVHYNGPRREGPLIEIDCASIPKQLVEEELLGAVGDSKEGVRHRCGRVRAAHGGTVLLANVYALPETAQYMLIELMSTGQVRHASADFVESIDIHVIATTPREANDEKGSDQSCSGLFDRLGTIDIDLPPLRRRGADIDALIDYWVHSVCLEQRIEPLHLSDDARNVWRSYPWPGNIAELHGCIARAALLAHKQIDADVAECVIARPKMYAPAIGG